MVSAALIGEEVGITPPEVTEQIADALASARLPVVFPEDVLTEPILEAMGRDKKTMAGRTHFVLVPRIGETIISADVPPSAVRAALERQRGMTVPH
jgi:3-dehydroquinate synthase